jgi:hypothetical protein
MGHFREPRNGTDLLRLLGVLNFFREFFEGGALRMALLYKVLAGTGWNNKKRKRERIRIEDWDNRWVEDQRRAFEDLKQRIASPEFWFRRYQTRARSS